MLRSFFSSVRSIITDMWTERHMARAGDVLLDSCGTIGVTVYAGARPQQSMMPRVLEATDWNHVDDTVMRRALSPPSLFQFLKPTSGSAGSGKLTSFCDLTGQGCGAIAQLVSLGSLPYFAQWRRGTLQKPCLAVGLHVPILPAGFNQLSLFVRMQDQTLDQLVRQSVANP